MIAAEEDTFPSGLIVADLNSDGRPDLLTVWGRQLRWLRNDLHDSGGFIMHSEVGAGLPAGLRTVGGIGDITGDGLADVVTFTVDRIHVHIQPPAGPASGAWPAWEVAVIPNAGIQRVKLADVDGDGDLDLVASLGFQDRLVWLQRDGPSFVVRPLATGVDSPRAIALADFDADGDVDVLSGGVDDDTIRLHTNLGPPLHLFSTRTVFTGADGVSGFALGDFNADGLLDFLSVSEVDWTGRLHLNKGGAEPTFEAQAFTGGAELAQDVVAADVDGDGDLDAVIASTADDSLRWHRNEIGVADRVTFRARKVDPLLPDADAAIAADFDTDGRMDVAAIGGFPSRIRWHRSLGGDPPGFAMTEIVFSSAFYGYPTLGDFDNDGAPDFSVCAGFGTRLRWYRNDPAQPTGFEARYISDGVSGYTRAVDIDSDGDLDIVVNRSGAVLWHENDGASPPEFETVHTIQAGPGLIAPTVGDLDGDGLPDVVVSNDSQTAGYIAWRRNLGGSPPSFGFEQIYAAPGKQRALRVADVTGDGHADVLLSRWNEIVLLVNSGAQPPTFTPHTVFATPRGNGTRLALDLLAGDLDGDGDLDVVTSLPSGGDCLLWHENLSETPPRFRTYVVKTNRDAGGIFLADMDGDGDLDILAPAPEAGVVEYFENLKPTPDLTADGLVNANDLAALLGSWGLCEPESSCRADINRDGLVGAADLAALLGAWSPTR